MSPTARSLEHARAMGFTAQVVERFNKYSNKRIDLFGIIDLVCCKPGVGILGVQATSGSNHAARRTKSLAEPRLAEWLNSGGRYEIWSFAMRVRRKKDGTKSKVKRYELRREEITAADLAA